MIINCLNVFIQFTKFDQNISTVYSKIYSHVIVLVNEYLNTFNKLTVNKCYRKIKNKNKTIDENKNW